jgi:hypothetical protein
VDPSDTATFLHELTGFGKWTVAARSFGLWELCLGVGVMYDPSSRCFRALVVATLTVLTLVLILAHQRAIDASCGCLGALRPLGWLPQNFLWGIGRNLLLIGVIAAHALFITSLRPPAGAEPDHAAASA